MSSAKNLSEDARRYYADGRRVMRNGVPCKVHSRRTPPETRAVKMALAVALAGDGWEPVPECHRFTFTPSPELAKKLLKPGKPGELAKASGVSVQTGAAVKAYYAGGHRMTVGGVPCRRARPPGPTAKAFLSKWAPLNVRTANVIEDEDHRALKLAMEKLATKGQRLRMGASK